MPVIGEKYTDGDLELRLLYWVDTPQVNIQLGIVEKDNNPNLKGDNLGEYDRFHTIITNKVESLTYPTETHFDIDHLINNLLCYNISLSVIESLIERELSLETFTLLPTSKKVMDAIKKSESHNDVQDIMYYFWVANRCGVNPPKEIKKRYRK